MNERDAMQLVKRLLTDALARDDKPTTQIRNLASALGDLRGTVRTCLVILDEAEGDK